MRINLNERNKNILKNIIGAFSVKGISLLISVMLMPAYMRFFHDQIVLGIWYTMLAVLNWVLLFDLGLGQGLRNMLPEALEARDKNLISCYVSTTYICMGAVSAVVAVLGLLFIPFLNWNSVFNVSEELIGNADLVVCVKIIFIGIILQLVLKIVTSILYALQKSAVVNMLALISNIIILIAVWCLPSRSLALNLKTMSVVNVFAMNLPLLACTVIVFRKELKGCFPRLRLVAKKYVKKIFNIGISLLWLQLVFMVISSTNEIMISHFTAPEYVVQFQAYFKIFNTCAMVASLALTPIWSAVTKAQVQRDLAWIRKIYKLLLALTGVCFLAELCIIPLFPFLVKVWLGEGTIQTNVFYGIVFCFSSIMMILHNVNTSIGNGLSYFRLQMVWMTVAAVVCIPLSYILVQLTGSWIGVVMGTSLSLIPYEVLAPFFTFKFLNKEIEA